MEQTKIIPVKVSLRIDSFLLYALQQTTNQSSIEIVAFFNDFGREVAAIGAKNRKNNRGRIRKDIRDFYPNSPIPFKLLVTGHMSEYDSVRVETIDPVTKASSWHWDRVANKHFAASVEVTFPQKAESFNSTEIDQKILENLLLEGDDMPAFKQPDSRNPKMFKDLIDRVLARKT